MLTESQTTQATNHGLKLFYIYDLINDGQYVYEF
jgi:hypothetical protein